MWTCYLLLMLQGSERVGTGETALPPVWGSLEGVPDEGSAGPGCTNPRVARSYVVSVCTCKRKRARSSHGTNKKLLPKGDKKGVTIHSQNNSHPFCPGAPWQPCHRWWGSLVLTPQGGTKTPCLLTFKPVLYVKYLLAHQQLGTKDQASIYWTFTTSRDKEALCASYQCTCFSALVSPQYMLCSNGWIFFRISLVQWAQG